MPKIILNKITTNPAIPRVPIYGFVDDFNRADSSSLGFTSGEGKPWVKLGGASHANGVILGNSAAWHTTGASSSFIMAVNADASDGILRARYSATASQLRMAVRVQDGTNYLSLMIGTSSVMLRRYINNAYTDLGSSASGLTLSNVDIDVVLAGSQVSVNVNGVQVITPVTVSEFVGNTFHGFHMTPPTVTAATYSTERVDSLEFIPA